LEEQEYIQKARDYLLSFEQVTDEIIDAHLNHWKVRKPRTISELFRAFLLHAQNRQGMPNSIGDIEDLRSVLCEFSPSEVSKRYQSWSALFDAIARDDYKPPGRLEKENNKSYWVIYCKSIISIADFLDAYSSFEDFDEFVRGFMTNEYSRLALPLLLKEEIFGFGFALACDFLKETGYPEFLKPDTHINDISRNLGITNSKSDFGVFKDLEAYCQRVDMLPYEVDKLFWLVGSGRFYLNNLNINTSKWDFIKSINC
tara:strand:- start:2442 stop:3212 length:771 start_codon:yes stop_codon:yes gene_type:complete